MSMKLSRRHVGRTLWPVMYRDEIEENIANWPRRQVEGEVWSPVLYQVWFPIKNEIERCMDL